MSHRWIKSALPVVLVGLAYLGVALALNHARGAVKSGFGAFDDEPSHLVTGLMVRDYLAQGCPGNPLRFAEEYYVHYPKVALGQWPPLFYVVQAVWSFPFGSSHASLIALMSVLTAATALAVFLALRDWCGPIGASIAGGVLLLLPLVQRLGASIMTEVPLALLCFLAAWRLGKFLDQGRTRDALGFGVLAVLAIMTKGSGLALALVPVLAILILNRWPLLGRPALWAAAGLVVVLCLPWFLITLPVTTTTWAGGNSWSWTYTLNAFRFYLAELVDLGGVGLAVLAVLGFLGLGARGGTWAALNGLLVGLFAFYVAIPSGLEERNLVLVAPVWVYLAFQAAAWFARRIPRVALAGIPLPAVLLAGLFVAERWDFPRKDFNGYCEAVEELLADEALAGSYFLIASDAPGEGLFIGSVALGEERPGHIVLRGTKMLSRSDWMGKEFESFYESSEELAEFLRSLPVGVVVLDRATCPRRLRRYHGLLEEVVAGGDGAWRLRAVYDVIRDGERHPEALQVFEQVGHQELPRGELDRGRILSRLRSHQPLFPTR